VGPDIIPEKMDRLARYLFLIVLLVPASTTGAAPIELAPVIIGETADGDDPHVTYEISFPGLKHHEAEVEVRFSGLTVGQTLEVRMSRTSPGRYALHEFAKNVHGVRAYDGEGNVLPIEHINPHQWDVSGHDGTVLFTYTLFADMADGTYSAIDMTHVHLNMPATFMWARGMEDAPIDVSFNVPESDWKIATQLFETGDKYSFHAPDLHYFLDSPTEISDYDLRTWEVDNRQGGTSEIRLAVHHEGTPEVMDAFTESIKKIVEVQYDVFGGPPEYDDNTYTFLVDYLPHVSGDGMEHRNSTYVTGTRPLAADGRTNLGTMAHEFFHQWNVERIRPESLEPFSYETESPSDDLWFAEGVTSYYTGLSIRRAGLLSNEQYASELSSTINSVVNSPGRKLYSAEEMSRQAPFMDRASSWDRTNTANTFLSYYTWGSAIGLALDLSLRSEFNVTLDHFMRRMWKNHGENELPYTSADLKKELTELTGSASFTRSFFSDYIEGNDVADYKSLLHNAGFLVRQNNPDGVLLGMDFEDIDSNVIVSAAPTKGTSFYESGLDLGDRLVSLDGHGVTTAERTRAYLQGKNPGDIVTVEFVHRGRAIRENVLLLFDPTLEVVPFELAGMELTGKIRKFRAEWLDR